MSETKEKVDRRSYLKYAGALVAAAVIAGASYYAGTTVAPKPTPAPPTTVTVTAPPTTVTVTKTVTPTPETPPPAPKVTIEDFLEKVSGPYKGTTIRIIAESTTPSMWLNETKRPRFEELTGITVEYELLGWDDVFRKARLDGAQKTGTYDLYYIDEIEILAEFFEGGYIVDWNRFADQHKDLLYPAFDLADFLPIPYFTYKGMLGGTPFEHFLRMIIYRKDLFDDPEERRDFKDRYGRELKPAETYDEYRQIAEFFTRPDDDLYGHNCQPNPMSLPCDHYIGMMTYGNPCSGYSLGRKASYENGGMVDSLAAIAWLKRYIDLLQFGPPGIENFTWDDEAAAYTPGRVAQGWVWTENFAFLQDPEKAPEVAGKLMCSVPMVEPKFWRYGIPTIYADSGIYAIAASAPNPEAAMLWQQYATCVETAKEQMIALKGLCTRSSLLWSSLADELDAKYKTNIYAEMRRAWVERFLAPPWFPIPEEPVMREILWKELVAAIAGEKTPEEALRTAAKDIDVKTEAMGFPVLKGY